MKSIVLVMSGVVALHGGVARAEGNGPAAASTSVQSSGFVAADYVIGMSRYLEPGVALEGGLHVSGPLFAHGLVAIGDAYDSMNDGSFEIARAGVEARTCLARVGWLCGFAGGDLGVEHSSVTEEGVTDPRTTTENAMLVVPRVGFEVGKALRLRGAIEAPLYLASGTQELGGMATVGVAYVH